MPIHYEIDAETNIVHEHWSGAISAGDMARHWSVLLQDPRTAGFCRHFADIRDASPSFDEAGLWSVVDDFFRANLGARKQKLAILIANQTQLQQCRNWKVLTFDRVATGIFSDPAKALHWLLANF